MYDVEMSSSLVELIRPAAELAVDQAIHAVDPARYHKRYAKGKCPFCSLLVNLMESAGLADIGRQMAPKIDEILARIDVSDGEM